MSMLSAQCDKLRELATKFDEIQVGATRAVRIPLDTGSVLREAADTIWELRDDLQRANAENAKLRQERDHWHVEQVHAYGNWEDAHKRAIELEKQNAKLRKLVKDMFGGYKGAVKMLPSSYSKNVTEMAVMHISDRMRELGVEP